jgi:hypothetical protein
MHDNRLSKAILSIVLVVGVIIVFATSSSKKVPPDEQKSPPLSANSVIHPISINTALDPLSKLEYGARHAMMKWLRTKIYRNYPINKMRERLT